MVLEGWPRPVLDVLCHVAQAAVAVGGIPRGLVLVFGDQGSARIGVDRLETAQPPQTDGGSIPWASAPPVGYGAPLIYEVGTTA